VTDRVGFIHANAAARRSIDIATSANVGATDLRVLLAVISFTALWSRLSDHRSHSQIAEKAGLARSDDPKRQHSTGNRQVSRSLKRLADLGAITYRPAQGRGHLSEIGLPKGDSGIAFSTSEKATDRELKGDKSAPQKATPQSPTQVSNASKSYAKGDNDFEDDWELVTTGVLHAAD
jgi:hypothetical protein